MGMDRLYVKQVLGSVCDTCKKWTVCDSAEQCYYDGCGEYELATDIECSVPCEQCYLFELGVCSGIEESI